MFLRNENSGMHTESASRGALWWFVASVRSEGLEPPTYKFVACCSIQLSYDRTYRGDPAKYRAWRTNPFRERQTRKSSHVELFARCDSEGERFELSVGFLDPRPFSKRLVSATHPSLRAPASARICAPTICPLPRYRFATAIEIRRERVLAPAGFQCGRQPAPRPRAGAHHPCVDATRRVAAVRGV